MPRQRNRRSLPDMLAGAAYLTLLTNEIFLVNEYLELKTVLTEEEYAATRQSTLTAFYTPPVVISAMYQALENMGLKSGNILEPSCGTGNFIGRKPESLSDCKVYGVGD